VAFRDVPVLTWHLIRDGVTCGDAECIRLQSVF